MRERTSSQEIMPSINKENTKSLGLIVAFVVLSLAIISSSALYYHHYEINFRALAEEQLSAIVKLKVNDLTEWRKERLADAAIFYRNGDFAALVKRYFKNPEDFDARDRLQTWLDKFAANKQYDRVFLLDTFGLERISKPDKSEPAAAHFAKDIAGVFHSGNITFLDFHRDTPDGPIHLALLVPIFDDKNNNRPLSVLVLRIDPNVYLYPYIQTWPIPSKTSETLIARREGNAALFLNELKFQKNTALKLQIPLKKTSTPVVEAVLGHEGTIKGIDYRGVQVLAAIRSVPESPWFMVARVDIGEVYAPLRERLWQLALFICVILAGIGGCLFLLLRQQRMRLYREQLRISEELRKSEENFGTIFENNSSALAIINRGTTIEMVNKEYCKLGLYEKEDVIGTSWTKQIPPEDLERLKEYNRKRLLDPASAPDHYEFSFYRKDGVVCDCLMSIASLPTSGKIICSFIDITQRKQAEESLKKHHSLLTALINSASDIVIFSLDKNYRYTAFNEKHREEMKKAWSVEIKIGDCILDFMGILELREAAKASMDRALGGEIFIEMQHQPNLDIYYEFCWNPVEINKEITGVTCFIRDITERNRAQKSLKESEEKFRNEFDNSAIGKSFTSLDGSVDVNPAFCEMLGYTKEELERQKWQDFTHPDDNELTKKLLKELLSGEKSNIRCRKRYIKKDGSIVWADVSTVLQKDKEGKPVYYITEVIDITDRKKAEEALQESERRLSEAQKMAQLGHWDWDIKTGKVVWSDEVYKIFRIDPENFTPHIDSILELSPWPEDHERDKELIRKAMESHEKGSYEQRFLRPDKSIGYYDSTFRGKYDNHGNLVSIVGTVQDITERKRVDEALRTSEARYRSYVDVTGQIGWVTNAEGEIVEDVPSLRKFSGQTYEEAKGSGWAKTLHPDDVESVLRVWNNAVSTKSPYEMEYRMRRHDGVYRDLLARGYPIFRKGGSIQEWVGTCIDITERKQAEETLRMNEARFRTLVENIPQKIFMKDRKVRWISINEKLAHDFGFRPEDVVGKMNADLFPPELAAKYQADDVRIMESGKTEELEEKYIREGRETWVNTIKTPVKNANGEIVGVLGVFWDITERKRMEEKLHQYNAQLEQKSRDLEQIIYVTSHDLRSPLVNIQGFAKELAKSIAELMDAVQTGDLSGRVMQRIGPIFKKDVPESLDYIQSGITQMDKQLTALLKLSRLGRAAITIEKLDINVIVDDVVRSLEFVANERGAKINVAELPPCMADAAQTNQIFLNLIGNALKYLDAKRPGVIHVRGNRQDGYIIYCVEDNGVGISKECREKIFEIFYRVEQNKCPGEGLGLTIVRQSAEKQNGAVWVESEAGKGSKFFVKLPGI